MFSAPTLMENGLSNSSLEQLWTAITEHYAVGEDAYLEQLLALAEGSKLEMQQIEDSGTDLIQRVRETDGSAHMVDALLQEYSLDTQEGILLMCLAEALMRIPDSETADALIKDKLSAAEWDKHLGNSESTLVNASTWGLLLTGKVVRMDTDTEGRTSNILKRLINRAGEPVIRKAMHQAMKIMGKQFVLGRTIKEALKNARKSREKGYSYSFDMLGEAAITAQDADQYFKAYAQAIETVAQDPFQAPAGTPALTVSIKLSALHPRYEQAQQERVLTEMYQQVLKLLSLARTHNVGITIDAEEADRLELSLALFEKLYRAEVNQGWGQLGLVVQAYSKRALPVLAWLTKLSEQVGIEIPVRLVKGAYWDSEIKLCQQMGIEGYPVFTRKEATDASYLACARFLLSGFAQGKIYPQFASHNAHTVASILTFTKNQDCRFEFQRLHGMGDALYAAVLDLYQVPVRIYAPVGAHKDLLPYLVRRLLENGANSSFVHRLVDAKTPVESLVVHPVQALRRYSTLSNHQIVAPAEIFSDRINSQGLNLHVAIHRQPLLDALRGYDAHQWQAASVINGVTVTGSETVRVLCPHRRSELVGSASWASVEQADQALKVAEQGFRHWHRRPVQARAAILNKIADLYEQHRVELMALCCREAGKTLQDGIDEIREAVDFCRYYAQQAQVAWDRPIALPGPTGESNSLQSMGRGVFLCISPWNFPLAIFTGQVVAALVSGNAVIAKPAEQTSLIAYRAVTLMLEAGIPGDVLQLLLGKGSVLGARLTAHPGIAGVAFTGSTQTAHLINRSLAAREAAIAPLIAETGGQNAMLVDSTALPEQVVKDVVQSAFASAGQRCSALRVLFVQADIADRIIELLKGAMQELRVGDPADYATDVGPVIDETAQDQLLLHIERMKQEAKLLAEAPMTASTQEGFFVRPTAFEIQGMQQLKQEHFGPILHLIRYKADQLDKVIKDINDSGYGLTLGIHSRNEATAEYIADRVYVGNVYVNRNQIGAVVGVQPFGGQGLSGTGPKAGGPHYLHRFVTEKTITINTTAVGGNATLLSLGEGND
jgi:RHH-type proline utilization regulon transcriptional repressor/proline dehydrogenase/delta 1-pyrroline-5-carboxylate dehydrogenase